MLITFKSRAAADVPMFAENAKPLLAVIGKSLEPEAAPRGIVTAADAPAALARLKAAAESARRTEKESGASDRDPEPGIPLPVGFAQRAFPLIEMLERAVAANRDVVWGV